MSADGGEELVATVTAAFAEPTPAMNTNTATRTARDLHFSEHAPPQSAFVSVSVRMSMIFPFGF